MTIENVASGGGGGGGGSEVEHAWEEAYAIDFESLADQDLLPGGDGAKTISGKVWDLHNSGNATAVAVGATHGGLKKSLLASTVNKLYLGEGRPGCYLSTDLAQYLVGTPAEGKRDYELRVSFRYGIEGAYADRYEAFTVGISEAGYASSRTYQHTFGTFANASSALDRMRCWYPSGPAIGTQITQESTLGFYPNCSRISVLADHLIHGEYGDAVESSLDDADFVPAYWVECSKSSLPRLGSTHATPSHFFFGMSHYYSGGGTTAAILKEFKVEYRKRPNEFVIFP